jgi:hypothetical protein
MRTPRRLIRVFALFLALAGAGCALLQSLGLSEGVVPFSHARHGTEEDLACLDCHAKAATEDLASMPKIKQCMTCHEGIDEKKPEERRLAALYGPKPQWTMVKPPAADLIFSHKLHVTDNKVECKSCHNVESENVAERMQVSMVDACMACHARLPRVDPKWAASTAVAAEKAPAQRWVPRSSLLANDCAVCHRRIRKDRPPESHEFTTDRPPRNHQRVWREVHGQVSRDSRLSKDRCFLCHTQASCSECHQQEAPASHTGLWRYQGHGIAAGIDRSACAVCHQSDACDRCHRDTAPRSHTGSWGSPRDRHCYYCHQGGGRSQQSCNLCHRSIAHNGPRRPTDPQHAGVPESLCRTCHSIIEMQHADNGDACVGCH